MRRNDARLVNEGNCVDVWILDTSQVKPRRHPLKTDDFLPCGPHTGARSTVHTLDTARSQRAGGGRNSYFLATTTSLDKAPSHARVGRQLAMICCRSAKVMPPLRYCSINTASRSSISST
jgi:hypothetical protein